MAESLSKGEGPKDGEEAPAAGADDSAAPLEAGGPPSPAGSEPEPGPATGPPAATEQPVDAEAPVEEDEGGDGAASATAAAAEEATRRLEAERDELAEQLVQAKDRWLRVAADLENFRKRAARQEVEATDRIRADVLRRFLPVMDNVERAIACASGGPQEAAIAEGLKLVLRSFGDGFAAWKLQRFGAQGQAFDPQRHEAVSQVETADVPAGTVLQELQPGYLLGDRLLRPALVVVAKPPRPAPSPEAPAAEAGEPEES